MKHNKLWDKPYRKLIQKIFIQTLLLALFAFAAVLFIRSVGQGKIGDFITSSIAESFHMDWDSAQHLYFIYVRQNIDYILLGTMILVFLLFIRMLLSWFMRYFDEIIGGINRLADGQDKQIAMSPELDFVSQQLNKVNNELIRSAEAEREAEKRKNDLVVYLAHDIKTPLTSVIGYLSLLEEGPLLPQEQRQKYIKIALKKSYRLESLISELFEITRYNLDDVPLQKENINLSYMMAQIADEAFPMLTECGKTVSVHIPEELTLCADPEKMARAFNNILKNAVSYSDAGSAIEISAGCRGGEITISFANAGTIPQDKLGAVFDKFYRMDEARQTATGGAGLGLAISKDIVRRHGGTITADSENNRTVFTITIPCG